MADDPAKKKEELVQILSQVEAQAQRLEVLGQDIVRSARLSRDVVGPIRDLLFHVPVANLSSERLDRRSQAGAHGTSQRVRWRLPARPSTRLWPSRVR